MNTTMAPMDSLRQTAEEALRRRHDYNDETTQRQRDGGIGAGGGRRGDGSGNGDDNNDDGGGGKGHGDSNGHFDGGKNSKDHSQGQKRPGLPPTLDQLASPSSLPSPSLFPTSSVTATVVTASSQSLFPTTTSNTFISTFWAVTSTPPISNSPKSTTRPRHGVGSSDHSMSQETVTPTTTSSIFVGPESAIASPTSTPSETPIKQGKDFFHHNRGKHGGGDLTPVAQHLLIAAGAIGAFIIVLAGIYFLTRMRKIDIFASIRNRKFGKGGSRGWYGWRKEAQYYNNGPPPKYSSDMYPSEKNIPIQQQVDAFYTPTAIPPMATTTFVATASAQSDPGRQEMVREASLDISALDSTKSVTQPVVTSATADFYGFAPVQPNPVSRQPGTRNSQGTFFSQFDPNTATQNTYLTMNTMRSMQTQDAYDPNQREPNHLSYLSSLSSGFGDGLIIPESTVVGGGPQSYRQSKAPGAGRFSWMTFERGSRAPGSSDRDTVYTQASVDSAPRFRTVNSWVAQQAGRVERRHDVPVIPAIPAPLQAGGISQPRHQREFSEDPAFRQHPGDEIPISRGVRVPSEILDRKTGVNKTTV